MQIPRIHKNEQTAENTSQNDDNCWNFTYWNGNVNAEYGNKAIQNVTMKP